MSQYPFPSYSPPPGEPLPYMGQPPRHDPRAPSRRASVLMWILGGLGLFAGFLVVLCGLIVPADQLLRLTGGQLTPEQTNNIDPVQLMRGVFIVLGVLFMVVSIAMIVVAFFVRRGGPVATITGIVIAVLIAALAVLNVVGGLIQVAGGNTMALGTVVIWGGAGVVVAILLVSLVQALRTPPAWFQQQAAAHWAWLEQQKAAFGTPAGYGYGPASATAAPMPPMPAPPPAGDPQGRSPG